MTSRPLFAFFGHHKCATMTLNTIAVGVCRRLGLTHKAVFNSDQFDHDLAQYCAQRNVDFLLYGNSNYRYASTLPDHLGFHIIRDPRDIVVSAYFSHMHSHPTASWPELEEHRKKLKSMDQEEGLAEEILFRQKSFGHMSEWDYNQPNVLEIRFESFVDRTYETLLEVFLHLGLIDEEERPGHFAWLYGAMRDTLASLHKTLGTPVFSYRARRRLYATELLSLIWRHRFEARSKGRIKGQEDVKNHYRKGRSGDWRTYFTPELKLHFKSLYPGLIPDLGYENSDNW